MSTADVAPADVQPGLAPILALAPVVPVVIVENAADAVPLARALVAGGLRAIEITLRTPAAMEAIRRVAGEVEGAVAGAGTVLDAAQFEAVMKAGAKFAVSPGATQRLLDAATGSPMPLLPGIATASEAMALIERGYRFAKFFPAEPAGGATYLAALASPLPQLSFCPTGGITPESAPRYLKLGNVVCVGGSWMIRREHVLAGDYAAITAASAVAAKLGAA
jgi:2-dehydro-3-deoxyphosphogluconate aldolase/(4S)-4-hydroxy-2-oxoglutarate aldolase